MKYFFYILIFTGSILKMHAQEESKTAVQLKEEAAAIYKNTVITINGLAFDYRVLKHYSEADLRSLPLPKLKQIHFIFTESYIVTNLDACANMSAKDIDVSKVEQFRNQNQTQMVEYGTPCKVLISLISKDELSLRLKQLAE